MLSVLISRAVEEGIAFAANFILNMFTKRYRILYGSVILDGGVVQSRTFVRLLHLAGVPTMRP